MEVLPEQSPALRCRRGPMLVEQAAAGRGGSRWRVEMRLPADFFSEGRVAPDPSIRSNSARHVDFFAISQNSTWRGGLIGTG